MILCLLSRSTLLFTLFASFFSSFKVERKVKQKKIRVHTEHVRFAIDSLSAFKV